MQRVEAAGSCGTALPSLCKMLVSAHAHTPDDLVTLGSVWILSLGQGGRKSAEKQVEAGQSSKGCRQMRNPLAPKVDMKLSLLLWGVHPLNLRILQTRSQLFLFLPLSKNGRSSKETLLCDRRRWRSRLRKATRPAD